MSFAALPLYVACQRVFIFVVYFVIDSVRKLLGTPLYDWNSWWNMHDKRQIFYIHHKGWRSSFGVGQGTYSLSLKNSLVRNVTRNWWALVNRVVNLRVP